MVGKESNIRGVAFYNGRLVAEIATLCGFTLALRQQRVFQNKFGKYIYEDILHFSTPTKQATLDFPAIRQIALQALHDGEKTAKDESILSDISAAIAGAENVFPSPLYPVHEQQP